MGDRLQNKVAIITGATSGIGKAAVELFAEEGAKVVFAGRRAASGEAVEAELRGKGYDVAFVQTDVSVSADLKNLTDKTLSAYGRIDVLFNNAGISIYKTLEELDMETADLIMNTNYRAMFELTKIVVPVMIAQGGGTSIINTSSIGGLFGSATLIPYCASKGAVRQFTKALAAEVAKHNIRVNSLHPGLTLTEMTLGNPEFLASASAGLPLSRGAEPREIAYGALFLASYESGFMTGAELVMDGGFTNCR